MLALNPWVLIAVILGLVTAGSGIAWKAYHLGQDSVIAQQARDDRVRMETLRLAQQAAAKEISKIEVKHVTVRQQLETEIREKPVYRDCVTDERVFDLTNEAITGHPANRQGELPTSGGDDGQDARGLRSKSF